MPAILGQARVDNYLTKYSDKLRNDPKVDYVAPMFFPEVKVERKTGFLGKYGVEHLKIYENGLIKAAGVDPVSGNFSVSRGTYALTTKAFSIELDQDDFDNAALPYDARKDALETVMDVFDLNREAAVYDALSAPANFVGTTAGPAAKWDTENGNPIQDIDDAMTIVTKNGGRAPNKAAMGHEQFVAFKNHPKVVERYKYVQGLSNRDALAWFKDLFGFDEVRISKAVYNDAAGDNQFLWKDDFWMAYVDPSPKLKSKSFGLQLFKDRRTKKVIKDLAEAEVVAHYEDYVDHIVNSNLMYLMTDVVS